MVIIEQRSSTIDTCQMNIKIDTDKPVTLSINTTNEHHHLHTSAASTALYHPRNPAAPPPPPGSMNGANPNSAHFHHHHAHLYNPSGSYNYASAPPHPPPGPNQGPPSTGYYSMQPNNFYPDPYSQCSSYWKAAAAAASSSADLSKIPPHHSNRLPYPMEHPHPSNMSYMSATAPPSSSSTGTTNQIEIKSEHNSPMKSSQLTISTGEDSNESHPTVTEDDNEEDDDDDMDMKTSDKDDLGHSQGNTPRKSNRRAEKPPCSFLYSFEFFSFE